MLILKKEIDEHERHSGNWKGVDFDVFFVKYLNYNTIIMSTYYDLMFRDNQKEEHILSKGKVLTFKYAEPFSRLLILQRSCG